MSDILVKNMEMPKACGVCSLKYNEYLKMMDEDKYGTKIRSVSKVYHVCRLVGRDVTEFADSGKRCPDCPLVEVPPHGRLIDADALPIKDEWTLVGTDVIWDAPTVLEATNE